MLTACCLSPGLDQDHHVEGIDQQADHPGKANENLYHTLLNVQKLSQFVFSLFFCDWSSLLWIGYCYVYNAMSQTLAFIQIIFFYNFLPFSL